MPFQKAVVAFLLLLHPVHGRRAVMDFADFMVDAGIEQNAFRGGGFAGVDVRANADIAVALYRCFSGHGDTFFWALRDVMS